jgi:hypothetical protein
MRLVTGGCSCTAHCWPTWADYLGRHYDDYINTGHGGADNQTIARNIIDTAQAGDVVVVQWTGFDRFNTFIDEPTKDVRYYKKLNAELLMIEQCGMDRKRPTGRWHYSGSIAPNHQFLKHFYHPVERFRNTLDAVRSVVMHSQLIGYQLWNFTMTDWVRGETETTVDPRLVKMHEREKFPHFYFNSNCLQVRDESEYNTPVVHPFFPDHLDTHPQPYPQWVWMRDHIASEIGITVDMSIEEQVKLDQQKILNGEIFNE